MNHRMLQALGVSTGLAMAFYVVSVPMSHSLRNDYLVSNLVLAYLPLVGTYGLFRSVTGFGWRDYRSLLWFAGWLLFLPNSFYMLTDVMHVADTHHRLPLLYAVVLFDLFAFLGMSAGFISVFYVHQALRRLSRRFAFVIVEAIFGLVSVGIYLGRVLRWNSWDIVIHPGALIQDALEGSLLPNSYSLLVSLTFFVLLSGLYVAIWCICRPED